MLSSSEGDIIERAYELARDLSDVAQIRQALKAEGFTQVEEHLSGKQIRDDLNRIIRERR